VDLPASDPMLKIEPLKPITQPVLYSEDDLHIRQFTDSRSRRSPRVPRKGQHRAA
jgi:hypothetical protein